MDYAFVKGHGTRNDFVLLPDANGRLELAAEQVARLCDRRSGIGADGVIRVVRTDATDDPAAVEARGEATWFMDYRNADGSLSEMCGNGARVFGLYLATHADVDPREPVVVATRAGLKSITIESTERITVDMGTPRTGGRASNVLIGNRSWPAVNVDMGNPHAVVFVDDLADAGELREEPTYDHLIYPKGVNIEFVRRVADRHVRMRVHERGSGETQSCGTGACAVMVATALADEAARDTPYLIDLPGGRLEITWTADDRVLMTGPAELVAEGIVDL